jgi:hypothetical protein
MVDIDTTGPGAEVELPEEKGKQRTETANGTREGKNEEVKQDLLSPLTHLRNLIEQWMFEIARTIKNKINRKTKN